MTLRITICDDNDIRNRAVFYTIIPRTRGILFTIRPKFLTRITAGCVYSIEYWQYKYAIICVRKQLGRV